MTDFTNVTELQNLDLFEDRLAVGELAIHWAMTLPAHIDTEKLQVNMSRLKAMHKIGAFSGSFVNEYQTEVPKPDSLIDVNGDGSTVAEKSSSKQPEKSRTGLINDPQFLGYTSKHYGMPIAVHDVYRPEALHNVRVLEESGKVDEQAWAEVLDKIIRESFLKAGQDNLKNRVGLVGKTTSYLMAACTANSIFETTVLDTSDYLPAFYLGMHAVDLVAGSLFNKRDHGNPLLNQRRWSLLINNQLDRYLALKGLSRMPGLIKSR